MPWALMQPPSDLCGCCGQPAYPGLQWCRACLPHLEQGELCSGIHEGDPLETSPCPLLHLWDQTFYAQTLSPCPYSVDWSAH